MCKTLTPIEITGCCRYLAILGQKRNLMPVIFSAHPHPLFKKRSRATALCWLQIEPTYIFFRTATLLPSYLILSTF